MLTVLIPGISRNLWEHIFNGCPMVHGWSLKWPQNWVGRWLRVKGGNTPFPVCSSAHKPCQCNIALHSYVSWSPSFPRIIPNTFSCNTSFEKYSWEGVPDRRAWQPTSVFLPGRFQRQSSLVGYQCMGLQKNWAWLKQLSTHHTRTHQIGMWFLCSNTEGLLQLFKKPFLPPSP